MRKFKPDMKDERKKMFGWLRREKPDREAVARLYEGIVAQSRSIDFYTRLSVVDSLDGRFDMLSLHVFLVMKRLKNGTSEVLSFSQALFDHMFIDMDLSLREIGVSDLSVGKQVKKMGQAFLGRAAAYDQALGSTNDSLQDVLIRNVYRDKAPDDASLDILTDYVRRADQLLAVQSVDELMRGECVFPNVFG